ncbi:hypothetical protein D3C81_1456660 [compost metagenome]
MGGRLDTIKQASLSEHEGGCTHRCDHSTSLMLKPEPAAILAERRERITQGEKRSWDNHQISPFNLSQRTIHGHRTTKPISHCSPFKRRDTNRKRLCRCGQSVRSIQDL